jgi:hypothetical protein
MGYPDEDAVVFDDGQGVRRLRGKIIDDPKSDFIKILRQDGEVQINRKCILKLEKHNGRRRY